MTKSDDYLWDPKADVDPEVARLEQLLAPLRHQAPLDERSEETGGGVPTGSAGGAGGRAPRGVDELRLRRKRTRVPVVLGIATAIAAALVAVVWWRTSPSDPQHVACAGTTGFKFIAKGGDVSCGDAAMATGELPIGAILDTGAHEAELAIAQIGTARLGTNTRVRLDRTSHDRHQLYLEHGHIHARVSAPPRIFAVATPSVQVTDLGCEYALDIDATGAGSIHVVTGKVELESGTGALVVVPAGSHARLLRGRRAGVPLSDRAGARIEAAVRDFEGGVANTLTGVLEAATIEDVVTVANLVELVGAYDKRRVLQRLSELVPAPQGLTIDEALADRALFEMWFDEALLVHLGVSPAKTSP